MIAKNLLFLCRVNINRNRGARIGPATKNSPKRRVIQTRSWALATHAPRRGRFITE